MSTDTRLRPSPGAAASDTGRGPAERPWLLVARREVLVRLTDKAFLLGTLITLLLVVGFVGYQIWSEERTDTHTIAVTAGGQETGELLRERVPEIENDARIELVTVGSDEAGVRALEEEDAEVLLRPADDGWTLVATEEVDSDLQRAAETVVREAAIASNAEAAGTSLAELQRGSSLDTELLEGDAEQQGFAQAMGLVLAFLFYMAALGFGYMLAGSVVEEKANRVVEIITTKIPVRQLLVGKIAGNTALAIAQTALLVGIGLVGISFTQYGELLPAMSQGIGWFVAFFLVGFCFIACWWAVAGALASRAEDLQSTASPLSFLMMGVFFGAFLLEDTALTVASYIPPFSCVLMPIRLLSGDAAWWEPVIAIGVLLAAMAATVVLAERLYRRALLQTHGRVTLKQAWGAAD
jgi:ABC-2 type transport system permease protein